MVLFTGVPTLFSKSEMRRLVSAATKLSRSRGGDSLISGTCLLLSGSCNFFLSSDTLICRQKLLLNNPSLRTCSFSQEQSLIFTKSSASPYKAFDTLVLYLPSFLLMVVWVLITKFTED